MAEIEKKPVKIVETILRAGCCLRGSDFFFSGYSVVHTLL